MCFCVVFLPFLYSAKQNTVFAGLKSSFVLFDIDLSEILETNMPYQKKDDHFNEKSFQLGIVI